MNKTEEAANLFVEKSRKHITKDSNYEKENFEALVFEKMVEAMYEIDNTGNLESNEVFLYAEKRITDLRLEQLEK
jgi:hypothetical protein